MTTEFDVEVSTRALVARFRSESDPVVKRNIGVVLRHLESELAGDIGGIMATMARDPAYRLYNLLDRGGQIRELNMGGTETLRAAYLATIADGSLMLQEYNVTRIVADHACVATEGHMKIAMSGTILVELGYTVSPGVNYLHEGRMCNYLPIDSAGLIMGEDIYFDPKGFQGIIDRPIRLG